MLIFLLFFLCQDETKVEFLLFLNITYLYDLTLEILI